MSMTGITRGGERSAAARAGADFARPPLSRDLLEELSTCLMSGLAFDEVAPMRAMLRDALAQVRGIVAAGQAEPGLAMILADARSITAERLEASGVALDWRIGETAGSLDPRGGAALAAALRALVSDILAHPHASIVRVATDSVNGRFRLTVTGDGIFARPLRWRGAGLEPIVRRIEACGGAVALSAAPHGFSVTIELPLEGAV